MAEVAGSTGTSTRFGADRWLELWEPAAEPALAFGASELVADPFDRRPAGLPADLDLGEPRRLRALLVLRRGRAARARSSTSTTCRCCPPGTPCSPPSRGARASRKRPDIPPRGSGRGEPRARPRSCRRARAAPRASPRWRSERAPFEAPRPSSRRCAASGGRRLEDESRLQRRQRGSGRAHPEAGGD